MSQVDIVDAAFEILEQKGFAAVSVRGVAAALGLTPTAIYTYFPSKNALMRAMVEELLAGVDVAAASDASSGWRDRVHALALAMRARLAEHAGAMVLVTSGPLDGPHALALGEALIRLFVEAGLPVDDAARAAVAVRAHVLGVSALEAAERAGRSAAGPTGSGGRATSGPLWTDASRYPLTEATAHLALAAGADDEFTWGINRLLDGLIGTVPARSA
ncbi:TetR family transcriptional regulator [Streptomyces sp. ISL-90]|nr:TetR family transcriptional regulator [Streptomyces sp. ISL-90]